MKYNIQDVLNLDNYLYSLALYEISEGTPPMPFENLEDAMAYQKKVLKKYKYYKDQIINGECTLDEINDYILKKMGPFKQDAVSINDALEMGVSDQLLNADSQKISSDLDALQEMFDILLGGGGNTLVVTNGYTDPNSIYRESKKLENDNRNCIIVPNEKSSKKRQRKTKNPKQRKKYNI